MSRAALLAIGLVAAAAASGAAAPPTHVQSQYAVTQSGVTVGRVDEVYERKGDLYSIQSVTRSEGVLKLVLDDQVTLESHGRVNAAGLQPLAFGQRRAGRADRDVKATFDWQRGVIHSSYRGEQKELPLPPHTQDRLSLMYQFMFRPATRGQVELPMSNGRKVDLYTYRFVEQVRLATPAGEFETLHYERVPRDKEDARAEIWIALDRFHLPVRVVFDDPGGLRLEQNLVAVQAR